MSAAFAAPVTATHVWDSTRNEYISSDHMRLAQLIAQYDERYSLEYVPENAKIEATPEEHMRPFRIVERTGAHGRQVVRYLTLKDMADPAGILTWLWEGDFAKHRPQDVFNRIEMRERADRMLKLKKNEDAARERQDMIAFGMSGGRDKKNYLRLGKNLKIAR